MLLMGNPIPILGGGSAAASTGTSPAEAGCQLSTCSDTVPVTPRVLWLAVRSAPRRASVSRVAFRICENENKSDGDLIPGDNSPPPETKGELYDQR